MQTGKARCIEDAMRRDTAGSQKNRGVRLQCGLQGRLVEAFPGGRQVPPIFRQSGESSYRRFRAAELLNLPLACEGRNAKGKRYEHVLKINPKNAKTSSFVTSYQV